MKTWNVPDMEARLETLRLWREYDRLHHLRSEEGHPSNELYLEYQMRMDEVRRWYDEEMARQSGLIQSVGYEAARDAYFANPGTVLEDEDGEPLLCVVTGAPILDGDETIETRDGSLILASAFVPREILDQFSGEDEEDDVEEAA